jgi:hypothetical protein
MAPKSVKTSPSRREVLRRAAAAATLSCIPTGAQDGSAAPTSRTAALGPQRNAPTAQPAASAPPLPGDAPWWMRDGRETSRVIEARAPKIVRGTVADAHALRDLLDLTIERLTDESAATQGWRRILGEAPSIAIKFNAVGANLMTTNDTLARVLVARLTSAGYNPARIMLVEASEYLNAELGTRKAPSGWGESIKVGGQPVGLANYLLEADAVINVAFLKTHTIAGMSCTMKNLAYSVIRHPARYHGGGCSPYVAEIIGNPLISSRLKLNLVNALQVLIDGGPDARPEAIVAAQTLLCSFDPAAVDVTGQSLLIGERRRAGLSESITVPYLRAAGSMGVGRTRVQDIERVALDASRAP